MDVLISQFQTFDQITDDDSGQILAASPDRFGITQVTDENGIVLFSTGSSLRRSDLEAESRSVMQALSQQVADVVEVHVEDDLVGAAAANAPPEKWRRLMGSSKEDGNGDG